MNEQHVHSGLVNHFNVKVRDPQSSQDRSYHLFVHGVESPLRLNYTTLPTIGSPVMLRLTPGLRSDYKARPEGFGPERWQLRVAYSEELQQLLIREVDIQGESCDNSVLVQAISKMLDVDGANIKIKIRRASCDSSR